MSLSEAILLAIVEGLTEFLPISSTGHMIIVSSWLGIAQDPFVKTYTVAIQLGAIASVVVLYWRRFFQSFQFYMLLGLAFLPAAFAGLLLGDAIDALLERVDVVATMLIIGGVIFLFLDKLFKTTSTQHYGPPSWFGAIRIGLFQCIALIPGVSRSAATIIGGLSQKLTPKAAAEFSFFLAVPTMLAATGYKLLSYYKHGYTFSSDQLGHLLVGNVVAFIVAAASIKSLMFVVARYGFRPFGYYRIAIGIIILILYFAGSHLSIL